MRGLLRCLLQEVLRVLQRGVHVQGRLQERGTHRFQMGGGRPEPARQGAGGGSRHEVAQGQGLLQEGAYLFGGVQGAETLRGKGRIGNKIYLKLKLPVNLRTYTCA